MTDVIVPIKSLATGKSRLAGVLDDDMRMELVLAMLDDLLSTLNRIDGVCAGVVASDTAVFDIAADKGARIIRETRSRGYNEAVNFGLNQIGPKAGISVVPGDVPLARAAELFMLLTPVRDGTRCVRIAPSRDGGGTNGLYFSDAEIMSPHFGPRSSARHAAAARAAGIEPDILAVPWLSMDIDTPKDLNALTRIGGGRAVRRCLNSWTTAGTPLVVKEGVG